MSLPIHLEGLRRAFQAPLISLGVGGERRGLGSAEPGNERGEVHDESEQSDLDARLSLLNAQKKRNQKRANRQQQNKKSLAVFN